MKALILAAGYATRLYPLTRDQAKPLLPVDGKPLIDSLAENISRVQAIDDLLVVTNRKFFRQFLEWAATRSFRFSPRVIDDGTTSNDRRLGAIGDLRLVVESLGIQDDLLVAAGDNVFPFELEKFAQFFLAKTCDVITCYPQQDIQRLRRTGVAILADDGRVLEFAEKPDQPKSQWAVPPLYLFTRETLGEVAAYLDEGNNPDAPGSFLSWLCPRKPVYALKCKEEPRDIGTPESYRGRAGLEGGGI